MQIKGDYTVPAPRERVWEYFTEAELLQQCIPGCEELKPIGDDTFEATIKVGIAAIKGKYKGSVKLENKQPPSTYSLIVKGESKIGFLKGTCNFTLAEDQPNQTAVTLNGELTVGGKLARVGQRVIGGGAKMTIGQFFKGVTKLAESETATKMEIKIARGSDKENPVAELWYDNVKWCEISQEASDFTLWIYSNRKKKLWAFPFEQTLAFLQQARRELENPDEPVPAKSVPSS